MNKYIVIIIIITIIIIIIIIIIIHSHIWPYTAIHSYTQLYQETTTLMGSWLYIAAAFRKSLAGHISNVSPSFDQTST